MLQRKVVKYGRRTKNMTEDEKLLPFLCYFSVFMNLTRKH